MSVALLTACAEIPLHANLSDAELKQRLDVNFVAGMTQADVEAKLTELKVPQKNRAVYDQPPAPYQELARLYEPGGFWLDEPDQMVRWVDAVFVFAGRGPSATLERTETFRRNQRYFHGEPVNVPEGSDVSLWDRYPLPPRMPREPVVR